jgi:hypothetical protein
LAIYTDCDDSFVGRRRPELALCGALVPKIHSKRAQGCK